MSEDTDKGVRLLTRGVQVKVHRVGCSTRIRVTSNGLGFKDVLLLYIEDPDEGCRVITEDEVQVLRDGAWEIAEPEEEL